jgi:hypothetical protein
MGFFDSNGKRLQEPAATPPPERTPPSTFAPSLSNATSPLSVQPITTSAPAPITSAVQNPPSLDAPSSSLLNDLPTDSSGVLSGITGSPTSAAGSPAVPNSASYGASSSSLLNNPLADTASLRDALRVLEDKSSQSSLKSLGRPRLLLLCTQLIDEEDPIWQNGKVTIDSMVGRLMAWVSRAIYNSGKCY